MDVSFLNMLNNDGNIEIEVFYLASRLINSFPKFDGNFVVQSSFDSKNKVEIGKERK